MCIRDRSTSGIMLIHVSMCFPNTSKNALVLQVLGTTARYSCLLYTSDAADERSSVDLGGRRIIKKKKKEVD